MFNANFSDVAKKNYVMTEVCPTYAHRGHGPLVCSD